uniref:Uncharacterized protein n=1 Tax=Rousettus aegyptiacus TaxID=9407 RepID=A0A7J8BET5_ROUAE|nr:hypothetical protein HJG63_009688 [Rousettus aegyptiacus]
MSSWFPVCLALPKDVFWPPSFFFWTSCLPWLPLPLPPPCFDFLWDIWGQTQLQASGSCVYSQPSPLFGVSGNLALTSRDASHPQEDLGGDGPYCAGWYRQSRLDIRLFLLKGGVEPPICVDL